MAVTLTFASANQPKTVHDVSDVTVFQASASTNYTSGTSATGAVHFKSILIPHQATILDVSVHHRQDGTTAGHCHTVGIAGGITSAALFGSESFSQGTRMVSMMFGGAGGVMAYKVSVSDDAATRYVWPTVTTTTTGSASLSLSIGLTVTWTMNKTGATSQ